MVNSVFDTDIAVGRPQVLSWSIRGGERPKYENFKIDSATGVVWKRSGGYGLNFEHQNFYWLTVRVQDNGVGQLYDEAPLQIEIQDVNEAPWGWGQNSYIQENRAGGVRMTSYLRSWDWDELDGRGSKITWDMDGGYSGFNWRREAIPFRMVPGSHGTIYSTGPVNYERCPIYYIRARVTDSGWDYPTKTIEQGKTVTQEQAKLSSIVIVTVIVINRNDQPKLANSERRVDENTNRRQLMPNTLVGETLAIHAVEEDSFDTLHWSLVSVSPGPNPFRINNNGQLIVQHRHYLNYESKNTYRVVVRIRDSGCSVCQNHPILSDTGVVIVRLNDLNEAAVFRSGAGKRYIRENSLVDGIIGASRRNQPYTGSHGYFRPVDPDSGQTHSFTVTGQPKRFKIKTISDKYAQLTVVRGAYLDYESFDQFFQVAVRVTDSGGPITAESPAITSGVDVTVHLIDVNEPPLLDDMALWVDENTPRGGNIGKPLMAIDPDGADRGKLRYSVRGDQRFGTRYSNSIGNLIVANEAMNYEATTRYTTTVYITDTKWGGWPQYTTNAVLTVRVIDINEKPNIDNQVRYIEENSYIDRFIGPALIATDPDNNQKLTYEIIKCIRCGRRIKIGACDGQLMINLARMNFEKKSKFVMTVKVTDNGITGYDILSDQARIIVHLVDINEPPTMDDLFYSIDENVPAGTHVGPGRPITVALGDVDNGNSSPGRPDWQSHTFKIVAGNDGDTFQVDKYTGQLSVKRQDGCLWDDDGDRTACKTLNYERRDRFLLLIETTDSGLNGGNKGRSPKITPLSVRSWVTIDINDLNEAPKLYSDIMWKQEQTPLRIPSLAYNMEVGSVWGSDEDQDMIRFDITAVNAEDLPFVINENTGLISVRGPGKLDYESKNGEPTTFVFDVTCSDIAAGRVPKTTTIPVTIIVIDVNENPVIENQAFTIAEDHGPAETVGRIISTDIDAGQEHVYTIESGNTDEAFRLLPNGDLRVVHSTCCGAEIDFETPSRQFYTLVVMVRDNGDGGLIDTCQVEVEITNTNEVPYFIVPNTKRLDPRTQDYAGEYIREINECTGSSCPSTLYNVKGGVINALDQDRTDTNPSGGKLWTGVDGKATTGATGLATYTIDTKQGSGAHRFIIDAVTGQLSVKPGYYLDYEKIIGSEFEHPYTMMVYVIATDQGLDGPQLSVTVPVRINILDKNEQPIGVDFSLAIGENSQVGDKVGAPVLSLDPDRTLINTPLDDLTYVIAKAEIQNKATGVWEDFTSRELWTIDSKTAQITINQGPTADSTESPDINNIGPNGDAKGIKRGCQNCEKLFKSNDKTAPCERIVALTPTTSATEVVIFQEVSPFHAILSNVVQETGKIEGCSCKDGLREDSKCVTNDWYSNEFQPNHRLTLQITDNGDTRNGGSEKLQTTSIIDIFVEEQNAPPTLRDAARKTIEVRHVSGLLNNVNAGAERKTPMIGGAVTGTDEDGDKIGYTIVGGNLDDRFSVDRWTGIIRVNNLQVFGEPTLNFEKVGSYLIILKATDVPPAHLTPMSDTGEVMITLVDVNEYPVASDALREVNENSVPGTTVGLPITAYDEDFSDVITFKIIDGNTVAQMPIWPLPIDHPMGADIRDVFSIDQDSGQISVDKEVLDYEWKNDYYLTIEIADAAGLTDQCEVRIGLLDTNDQPALVQMSRDIIENSPEGSLVGTSVKGFDQDSLDVLSYSLTGDNCWHVPADGKNGESYTTLNARLRKEGETSNFRFTLTGGNKFTPPGTAYVALVQGTTLKAAKFTGIKLEISRSRYAIHECNAESSCLVVKEEAHEEPLQWDKHNEFWVELKREGLSRRLKMGRGEKRPLNSGDNGVIQWQVSEWAAAKVDHVAATTSRLSGTLSIQSICWDTQLASAQLGWPKSEWSEPLTIVPANPGGLLLMDSQTGQLLLSNVGAVLDYEVFGDVSVEVTISDGKKTFASCVKISLINVNEKPTIQDLCKSNPQYHACPHVNENDNRIKACKDCKPQDVYTVATHEQDTGDKHSWTILSGNKENTFAVGAPNSKREGDLVILKEKTPSGVDVLNFESPMFQTYLLFVRVTEVKNCYQGSGQVATCGFSPFYTDEAQMFITVDDVNEPPVLLDATFDTWENGLGATGVEVGRPMIEFSSDVDKNSVNREWMTLVFTIDATCSDCILQMFAIHKETGQITLFPTTPGNFPSGGALNDWGESLQAPVYLDSQGSWKGLDYETKNRYELIIWATDGGDPKASPRGYRDSATVIIDIKDVNENPLVQDFTLYVDENAPTYTPLDGTIKASDPDVDSPQKLKFRITSSHGYEDIFKMSECDGKMSLAKGGLDVLNYEIKSEYIMEMTVTDDGELDQVRLGQDVCSDKVLNGLCDKSTITVRVRDRNEGNTFTNGQIPIQRFVVENKPGIVAGEQVGGAAIPIKPLLDELAEVDLGQKCPDAKSCDSVIHHTWKMVSCVTCADIECAVTEKCDTFFRLEAKSGQLFVTDIGQNVVNYEMRKKFTMRIQSTDSGIMAERNDPTNKDDQIASETWFELHILDQNEAPDVVDHVFDIDEHSIDGHSGHTLSTVGTSRIPYGSDLTLEPATIIAFDPDNFDNQKDIRELGADDLDRNQRWQLLHYEIRSSVGTPSNDDTHHFVINDKTGRIDVAPNMTLDYERDYRYTLEIRITDDYVNPQSMEMEDKFTDVIATINVRDINERPTIPVVVPHLYHDASSVVETKDVIQGSSDDPDRPNNRKAPMFSKNLQPDGKTKLDPTKADTALIRINEDNYDDLPTVRYVYENSPVGTLMHAHKINSWRADMSIQQVLDQVREGDNQQTKPWRFGETDHERTAWHIDNENLELDFVYQWNEWKIDGGHQSFEFSKDDNACTGQGDKLENKEQGSCRHYGTSTLCKEGSCLDVPHGGGALSGHLTVRGPLDYEVTKSYTFTVTVTDSGSPPLSRSAIYTIHVLNVNEEPWTPDFAMCVNENTAGWECDCDSATEICDDWAVRRCIGGRFSVGFSHVEPTGLTLPASHELSRKIKGPTCNARSDWESRNQEEGVYKSNTLKSFDPDIGDVLTYKIVSIEPAVITSDKVSAALAIDAATGRLYLPATCQPEEFVSSREKSCFDYERQQQYNITIRTTDSGGLSWDSKVDIDVTDINEQPVVVIPAGEEYKDCGGAYAGQQAFCSCPNGETKYQLMCLTDTCTEANINKGIFDGCEEVECTRGLTEGFCVGCPLVFEDQDQLVKGHEDEFTKFECSVYINGACADSSDAGETGFQVATDGRLCTTRNIDSEFTETLKRRRRRLRAEGRRLAADDVTVCMDSKVTDKAPAEGERLTSVGTQTCITIMDVNNPPTMSNQTFTMDENVLPVPKLVFL